MPRPPKCRRVCRYPETLEFVPAHGDEGKEPVILTVDEYETLRLIDKEGLSQEQCSERMQVARTTVQMIYNTARKKLADVLVEGLPLRIGGGSYQLCDGKNQVCHGRDCYRQVVAAQYTTPKGEHTMRIAVTYENGQIFQHFGHSEFFKVYEVEGDKIVSSQVVSTNGSGHGALAGVLHALNADALTCGGIGGGAQMALAQAGIRLYGGVQGDADAAVEAFVAGNLAYDPDAHCDHHDHAHGEGHTCGDHGCGNHSCH